MARHLPHRWLATAAVVLALLVPAVIEAVWVSPTAVFMDDASRNAQVTLGNSSDVPEEVTIELKFGFLDTDSLGTPFIRLIDDPGPEFPSAARWVGLFPQRARLEPGEKRVVRLFARPPADLPDGEYWSRLIVTSRRAATPAAVGDTAAHAGVTLEIRLVTSVIFRKGAVQTSVTLSDLTAAAHGDSLVVRAGMDRVGNAAYLGTGYFDLLDATGTAVRQWSSPLAVYYPINRRFVFPLDSLPAGDYVLRLRAEAVRPDIQEGHVLPATPVSDSIPLRVD
jgi:P pilus assembly chaperone PapD